MEVIGLLVFTIWRILHMCTHRITCVENSEPKKGRLGTEKCLQDWKKESYRNYSSNFDEPAYHFGVQVLGAPPMYGYNRVLGQLSRRNSDQRKYKNQPRVRIDRDSQSK